MTEVEITLTTTIPEGVDYDRAFDALADLVHEGTVPGVEVMCSGQGSTRVFEVRVWIDPEYDPKWNEVAP